MNKQHPTLFILAALALSCCAPYPSSETSTRNDRAHGSAAELKQFHKVPTGHPDPQGRANMVLSPFRPYNIIDVRGYQSGDIVGDPSTAIVNPSTGKREPSTAKYFRVP